MKKILGISLCALFAVSAANANIASEGYVNEKVGSINLTGITTNANNISALTTRVDGHDTSIQANTTKINTLDTAIQGMSQTQTQGDYVTYVKQVNGDVTAEGASFDTSVSDTSESNKAPTSKAVAAYVKGKVDGLGVTALTGRVDANETAINTLDGRVTANEGAITALQATAEGLGALARKNTVATADIDANAVTSAQIANDAVTSAKIDDETITNADVATNAAIASSKIAFNPTQTAVFGSGITREYVNKIDANATAISENAGDITALDGRVTANEGAITALQATAEGLGALARKNTVATADIDANAVTSAQIANDAVTSAKIDDETITNADVATNAAIASSKIAFNQTQTTVFGSGINSGLVEKITTNENEVNRLGVILKPSEQCLAADNSDGCTLVVRNGTFSWEAVTRGEEE